MIKSMTGFASLTRDEDLATISVTIRSVNHRFLDVQLRAPAAARRSRVQAAGARPAADRARTDRSLRVAAVARRQRRRRRGQRGGCRSGRGGLDRARERGLVTGSLTAADLLRVPAGDLHPRTSEGRRPRTRRWRRARKPPWPPPSKSSIGCGAPKGRSCAPSWTRRRTLLGDLFDRAAQAAAAGAEALRTRLTERVRELHADPAVDESTIAQEIVRFANRSDITEETVRFRAHLEHWRALSDAPEPCGRKLDFLLQEMNREINTLGAKAEGAGVSGDRRRAEGGAREDARAGPECRIAAGAALLFVVSAPSGTGKTTIVERLVQVVPDLSLSRSYTSRPARDGECDGKDYNFITRERFDEMVRTDAFLEWADVFGNRYGTGAADADRELSSGRDLVLVIDVQGARTGTRQTARHHRDLHVAPVVRGARAPFARPQQGFRKRRSGGGWPPRARRSRPCPNTTTSWSTTSWTRAWTACGRSCSPSGPGSAR